MANKILLIGVDGGATEIRAHAVACDDLSAPTSFHLQEHTAAQLYTRVADFEPVPVADQFAQRSAGKLEISEAERKQAGAWVSAAAAVVNGVARQSGATCVLVGVGMPGLKTSDQRGIAVINNGPRIPEYLAEMEQRLADDGLALAAPIAALGSDADYCGLGEQHAAEGLFRDVENAYYVGGGTGVADALKLAGRLVPFDGAKSWIQKSWQIASSIGPTFEKLISAKSFNDVYQSVTCGGHAGVQPNSAAPSQFPERAAAAGDPIARAWTQTVALVLAELIFERVWTVANGRPQNASRGAGYLALDADHPFRGTVFDRVIVGQRLGCIYADHDCHDVFGRWVDEYLAALIMQSEDSVLRRQLLVNTELRPGFLVSSRLRAAPALGAAVAAARAFSCAQ
jgi:hypothetical protein